MPDEYDEIIRSVVGRSPSERVRRIARQSNVPDEIAEDYLSTTKIESNHNVNVRDSPKGAQGFGQVMPDVRGGTTRIVGGRRYNLRDPDQNIEAGLRYFAEGGSDPIRRRLYYFGGPRAAQTYDRSGRIPNISDGNMTAAQYVRATGGQRRISPAKSGQRPTSDEYSQLIQQVLQKPTGELETGNIDLMKRPVVRNSDGSISTVRSMSINVDDREILIPTISDDGQVLSPQEAEALYKRTGKHLGVFNSPESATAYAEKLHNEQAAQYGNQDEYSALIREVTAPGLPETPRTGRGAPVQPVPLSRGANRLPATLWGRAAKVPRQPSRRSISSPADFKQADEALVAEMTRGVPSTNPRGVDLRVIKGEQPSDPLAYSRAQELVGRSEPQRTVVYQPSGPNAVQSRTRSIRERLNDVISEYAPGLASLDTPAGIKTDVLRGAVRSLNVIPGPQSEVINTIAPHREITPEERLIDPRAESEQVLRENTGATATGFLPYVAAGRAASMIQNPLVRDAVTFGTVELGRQLSSGKEIDPQALAESIVLGGAMGKIVGNDSTLKRRVVGYIVPQLALSIAKGETPEQAIESAITNGLFALSGGKGKARRSEGRTQSVPETLQRKLRVADVESKLPEGATLLNPTAVEMEGRPRVRLRGEGREISNSGDAANRGAQAADSGGVEAVRPTYPQREASRFDRREDVVSQQSPPVNHPEGVNRETQTAESVVTEQPSAEPENIRPTPPAASPLKSSVIKSQEGAQPVPTETTPSPALTSARKGMFAVDRAELDLPELGPAERKSWQQSLSEAKPESANRLADEVLSKPRALNDSETASIVVRAQQVKNEHAQKMREIGDAADPETITQARNEIRSLEAEFDRLTQATKASGTEKGRALASQKLTINQDYDLVSMVSRAKAAKGRELTTDERSRYESQAKQIADLESKLIEAQEKGKTESLQKQIDRVKRQTKRAETKQVLDEEFASLRAEFAKAKIETRTGVQASGLAGLDPEGKLTVLIAKMARNRVKAGVTDAAQLVDEVYTAVKEHVDVAKRDVRDAISGYGLEHKDRRSELAKQLAEIRSELQSLSKQEDVSAGVRSPRSEGPRESEAKRLPMEGPRKSEARLSGQPLHGPRLSDVRKVPAPGPRMGEAARSGVPLQGPKMSEARKLPAEGPKLSEGTGRKQGPRIQDAPFIGPEKRLFTRDAARRKQLESQAAELERRIREGDFSPRPKREPIVYSRETQRLQERVQKIKSEYEAELDRADPWHHLRNISGIRKAGMLSGVYTHLRNIGGTAAYQAFEETRRIPSVIADAALSAATGRRTVTLSPSAMLDGVVQAATVGRREAGQILRRGATKEQLEKQQLREINTGVKAIDLAFNSVFRFMSASDRVFYNQAFKRNLVERAQAQAITERRTNKSLNVRERTKELVESPSKDMEADSKHDALVATFNSNNRLSNAIKRGRSGIGPVGNFAVDLVLPFDRTPTNVLIRVAEASPLGYGRNAKQLVRAMLNRSMSGAEQRAFSETFGRAATGTALLALGFGLAARGLISVDDYQNAYLNLGKNQINLNGVAPLGTLLAVGAGIENESRKRPKSRSYASPVIKPALDQPLLRATSQVADVVEGMAGNQRKKEVANRAIANTAFSFVPMSGMVRTIAQMDDPVRRKPKGVKEQFQINVPVWRRSLKPRSEQTIGRRNAR